MNKETVIIKAGGSIFSKSANTLFDYELANDFKELLTPLTKSYKFIITLGGGYLSRKYQSELREYNVSDRDLDWVGASSNNHNAMVMRIMLGELAEEKILVFDAITNTETISFDKPILLVGGEKPGQTGDGAALTIALKANAQKIFSLKNVKGVYESDPKKNPEAKRFKELSWSEYMDLLPSNEHSPGNHLPVDPYAAKLSKKENIRFIIIEGTNLNNMAKAIKGEDFVGTTIS